MKRETRTTEKAVRKSENARKSVFFLSSPPKLYSKNTTKRSNFERKRNEKTARIGVDGKRGEKEDGGREMEERKREEK